MAAPLFDPKYLPQKTHVHERDRDSPACDGREDFCQEVARRLGIQTVMGREYLAQAFQNAKLFDAKQQDYGSGNIARFGEKGVIVRASDKVERLKHLVFDAPPEQAPRNEAVADSWDDLANYGVIGRLCRDRRWE